MGTIAYMSPEQACGEELDARTDLFSFGAVLYETATGRQAFGGSSTAAIFTSILRDQPARPSEVNPELPAELDRLITKALEKDRNLRYQHAADILTDLKRQKRETDSGGSAASLPRPVGPRPLSRERPALVSRNTGRMPVPQRATRLRYVNAGCCWLWGALHCSCLRGPSIGLLNGSHPPALS